MYFAIDKQTGFMYESRGESFAPVLPTPALSHARIMEQFSDHGTLPGAVRFEGQPGLVFREDQFDPVTRTRRGRLYEGRRTTQPSTEYAYPHPYEIRNAGLITTAGDRKQLYVYVAPTELLSGRARLQGLTLALGTSTFSTTWRVIQVEMVGAGDILVTLKSLSTFGIIPELDEFAVPPDGRVYVRQALERVLTSAFRETAVSVVDHCRAALTVLISRWLASQQQPASVLTKDLGDLCSVLDQAGKSAASSGARIVARLHARGKPNVQNAMNVSPPVDEDAELSLHVLGFVLRELGWARSSGDCT